MDVLVLQHIACEPPGAFEDVLRDRGANLHRVELDEGDPLPPWQDYVAIVAMGGPMSVNDDAELPWLTVEKQAIAEAVRAGVPYWGVMPRRAAPGRVARRARLSGHPAGGRRAAGDAHRRGARRPGLRRPPAEFLTLQWHGDTFDLPEGAVRLASSPAYPNQAFRFGQPAYGVQFHVEVTDQMAREWARCPGLRRVRRPRAGRRRHRPADGRLRRRPRSDARRRPAHVRALGRDCRLRPPIAASWPCGSRRRRRPTSAWTTTRCAGSSSFATRRRPTTRSPQELGVDADVVTALVKADDAQVVAHRIATGEEPMYPTPEPSQRVVDARSGSSAVPLAVLVVVLLGTIVYALVR